MTKLLVIGAGGCLGAVARYGLAGLVQRLWPGRLPLGTLLVNVLGCLVIGALMAWIDSRPSVAPPLRLFLLTGLLGAFTTFSTFGYETFALLRAGDLATAGGYVLLSVAVGLAAVLGGHLAARALLA